MEQLTKEVLNYKLIAGVDCGNYETEVAFYNDSQEIIYYNAPSVIHWTSTKHPELDSTDEDSIKNLLDNLRIHFKSENIHSNGFYLIGNAALKSTGIIENMELVSNNKSDNDIPVIMSTTSIAASILREHYDKHKNIPSELNIKCNIGTAIPSSEYSTEKAANMEKRLKGIHNVDIHLAKSVVSIRVEFENVKCTEEGKTSMLAFSSFEDNVLKNYNSKYGKTKTVSDFKDQLTFHIDIGDGTTEFTAIDGLNPVASFGTRFGVGKASEQAIQLYSARLNNAVDDLNRQEFMSYVRGEKGRVELAKECFEKAVFAQTKRLLSLSTAQYVALTKASASYIFVHGGGACVFESQFSEPLYEFAESVQAEVVYIPCEYATHMNSTGCLVLATLIFNN